MIEMQSLAALRFLFLNIVCLPWRLLLFVLDVMDLAYIVFLFLNC